MAGITRRHFFKLTAGAAAMAAVPANLLSEAAKTSAAIIWADGIYDDAPGPVAAAVTCWQRSGLPDG